MSLNSVAERHVNRIEAVGRIDGSLGVSAILVAEDGVTLAGWQASAAAATTVVSSDGADNDSATTGAQTVRVIGIDGEFQFVEEVATLNGTNAVTLNTQFLRVLQIFVCEVGSGGSNAGTIDALHGATVLNRIGIGDNQSFTCAVMVPAGHSGGNIDVVFGEIEKAIGATAYVTFVLWTQKNGEAKRKRLVYSAAFGGTSSTEHSFGGGASGDHGFELDIGEEAWIEAQGSATSLTANASFELHFR